MYPSASLDLLFFKLALLGEKKHWQREQEEEEKTPLIVDLSSVTAHASRSGQLPKIVAHQSLLRWSHAGNFSSC
jgi:hypothetical protein